MKNSKLSIKSVRGGYLLVLPLMTGFLVFYAIPFLIVLYNSITKGMGNTRHFVGFENYKSLFENAIFRLAFGNTVRFLLIALPAILVLSYTIALFIKNHAKKNQQLKSVLLLPYIMPVAGTVLLIELLFAETGIVNTTLYTMGLPVVDWLHSKFAFLVVVLLYIWKNAGYTVILLLSGLVTISEEQYTAASIDGATAMQMFVHITTPQMWYSVFFAIVFSLINAFKCFREIFLIGGTHPDASIYMLQHFINNAFEKLSYTKLAVASVFLFVVITTVFAVFYAWVMRKEAYKE